VSVVATTNNFGNHNSEAAGPPKLAPNLASRFAKYKVDLS